MPNKEKKLNKVTQEAGLATNVNSFRAAMIAYFKSQDMYTTSTNEDGEEVRKLPQISGAKIAVAAATEKMANCIGEATRKKTIKDKSGLRTANRGTLKEAIKGDIDLRRYFNDDERMVRFNEECTYEENLPISKNDLNLMITKWDKKFNFTPKGRNLFCYLVSVFFNNLVNTSFQFMSHANKKTLNGDTVIYSIRNRIPSALAAELISEVNRAMTAIGDEVTSNNEEDAGERNENSDGDSDRESDDEEDEEDEVVAKSTKSSKSKKTSQIEQSDSDDDNDNNSSEDEEEVEEIVAQPPKKNANKGKNKKRNARRAGK